MTTNQPLTEELILANGGEAVIEAVQEALDSDDFNTLLDDMAAAEGVTLYAEPGAPDELDAQDNYDRLEKRALLVLIKHLTIRYNLVHAVSVNVPAR